MSCRFPEMNWHVNGKVYTCRTTVVGHARGHLALLAKAGHAPPTGSRLLPADAIGVDVLHAATIRRVQRVSDSLDLITAVIDAAPAEPRPLATGHHPRRDITPSAPPSTRYREALPSD